ncbi:hypothetical protein PFAG_04227 [Plasmodium falciparum Santa Lucia]|uniref:Surface antigen n=1 Tax=Plasmodium falciparum Santa Lucia TaxID=478859 RepID=W7FD56_PLAFA|nr:hypothetical protein PFAG_04227 [Plasmodium falciparum Santa Lucia]
MKVHYINILLFAFPLNILVILYKIEKELSEKLGALQTDIRTEDIPTCVCEKSVTDKVEKCCLKCGYGLGGALTSWEILGYTGIYGWANFATTAATKAATEAGMTAAIEGLKKVYGLVDLLGNDISKIVTATNYGKQNLLISAVQSINIEFCETKGAHDTVFCFSMRTPMSIFVPTAQAAQSGAAKAAAVTGEKMTKITTTTGNFSNFMIASGVAIFVIVLVMVIIYLILRYRRKKLMKRKLQYLKLLKE